MVSYSTQLYTAHFLAATNSSGTHMYVVSIHAHYKLCHASNSNYSTAYTFVYTAPVLEVEKTVPDCRQTVQGV